MYYNSEVKKKKTLVKLVTMMSKARPFISRACMRSAASKI